MDYRNPRHSFLSKLSWRIVIFIYVVGVVLILVLSQQSQQKNVESRAPTELRSTVRMQAEAFSLQVDEQFEALDLVADMLKYGCHFESENFRPTLTSVVRTFRLCTLALADPDGNVTDYEGNVLGDIGDRAYYSEVISGSADRYCEYLATTKQTDEPRVIFSIPAWHDDGSFLGVLFCSKEISVLEDSLFAESTLFDPASDVFICDGEGNVLVANDNAYANFEAAESEAAESEEADAARADEWSTSLKAVQGSAEGITTLEINGTKYYAACAELGINDWSIYCFIDAANASVSFSAEQERTNSIVTFILAGFTALLLLIAALVRLYVRRKHWEANVIRRHYENYKSILKESRCAVIEYDLQSEVLTVIQPELGKLNLSFLDGAHQNYDLYKQAHPEFDFAEMERLRDLAQKDGRTYSFESMLMTSTRKLHWFRVVLIPMTDEDGKPTQLLFAIFDVSDAHFEQKDLAEAYSNIPAGIYRCSLSGRLHLDFFSDGLCKMLGFSREEIQARIGPERRYSLLICEEDRPVFLSGLRRVAKDGDTNLCEYRLVRADGSLLSVSDTMDARRSSSGILYGYSVVVDLQQYKEAQQKLEEELESVRDQLEQTRIRTANSQMQPHFLYNALSSIREIVLEDPEYASELIFDFTTHLRACIRSMASDNLVPFSQELENIRAYVNIEKMRFGDRLKIEYDCPEKDFDIIPLSIQPLVENAVRHGVYERGPQGGTVRVRTERGDSCVRVIVEDDGVGFDFDATMKQVKEGTRDSNGLYNLIFRFEKLMNARVDVESTVGKGTKITVTIPTGEQS